MEIKKDDFVKFRIVNTVFYALPCSFFDEEEEPIAVVVAEVIKEVIEIVEPTKEEIAAKLKEEKKAKLLEQLAELEE